MVEVGFAPPLRQPRESAGLEPGREERWGWRERTRDGTASWSLRRAPREALCPTTRTHLDPSRRDGRGRCMALGPAPDTGADKLTTGQGAAAVCMKGVVGSAVSQPGVASIVLGS